MKKGQFTKEQIIGILREVQSGQKVSEVCRKYRVSEGTYYRWKSAHGRQEVRQRKAFAYVTRSVDGRPQLLVYAAEGRPQHLRVPGGTVEDGERPQDAVLRELEEETGLQGFTVLHPIAAYDWWNSFTDKLNQRIIFHVLPTPGTPETWDGTETAGGTLPPEEWVVFHFRWVDLSPTLPLESDLGRDLHRLHGPEPTSEPLPAGKVLADTTHGN